MPGSKWSQPSASSWAIGVVSDEQRARSDGLGGVAQDQPSVSSRVSPNSMRHRRHFGG